MKRKILFLTLTVMLLAVVAMSSVNIASDAQSQCKRVNGRIISQLLTGPQCTSPIGLCTIGRFIGGINGDFTFVAQTLSPTPDSSVTGVFYYTGDITIMTNQGNIFDKDAGAFNVVPNSTGDFASVSTTTGGTGRYVGASGRIRIAGTFTPEDGGDSEYEGEVCTQ